jgi:small ligand-binding sensory domain FIST
MARFGDGLAVDTDLVGAAAAAVSQALAPLGGRVPDLACVFVCGDDPDEVAVAGAAAADLSGAANVIGCSAGGVIGAGRAVEVSSAVSVWAGVLPGARIRTFRLEAKRADDTLAVLGLPQPEADDEVGLLIADPYSFPVDGFVERSNEVLSGMPLVGGLATGLHGAGSTRLFLDGVAMDRGAVGAFFGAGSGAEVLVSQGCRPIGPVMAVTAAAGNELLELAGVPAYTKLEQIIGGLSAEDTALVARGLQIGVVIDEYAEEHKLGNFLIRGVVGADPGSGSLMIGDIVDVGQTVRFQVRDAATADADLAERLTDFRDHSGRSPFEGALLFSCNGRGASLFPSADHDVRAVCDGLGVTGVAGFFAAGEIGPVGGRNHLHGYTASVLAFGAGLARS